MLEPIQVWMRCRIFFRLRCLMQKIEVNYDAFFMTFNGLSKIFITSTLQKWWQGGI